MYKIRNNFLINQNLSIILLRSVDIYHKYLYFYMFSVKRLTQWSKVNRMLVLNSKYKHILLFRLYFIDTHELQFLRLSILEVYLNTFKFNCFFKGIFLTKLRRDYLIENKSCLFSFNNDKQLIILSFFKNYYKLIRNYGESLLLKDIFLISKSSLFFFGRKNE